VAKNPPPPAGAVAARALLLQTPSRPDGRSFCAEALAEVQTRVARGERCIAVFDIDNTVVDTRPRTVAAARAFGEQYGITRLAEASLADVGVDGRSTCRRLGLGPGALTDAFQTFWMEWFWQPESFALDTGVAETIDLARAARDAGAEVYFLTGRVEALAAVTLEELRGLAAFGLPPVDAAHLVCKPNLDIRTSEMKDAWLQQRLDEGCHVAFFITEGERDIAHIRKRQPELACVLCAFPVDTDVTRVPADTPCFSLDG
jgi:hypothetical protein